MNDLTNYFLEANIILLFSGLIYWAWLRHEHHFQMRRFYILLAGVCALMVPLLDLSVESVNEGIITVGEIATITLPELFIGEQIEQTAESSFHWSTVLRWVYLMISSGLLIRLAVRVFSILKIISNKKLKKIRSADHLLVETEGRYPTFSFFSHLFLNNQGLENEQERQQVIAHELAHIRQYHSIDVLFLEMLSTFFWYNPMSWYLKKSQAENHEYLADAEVAVGQDKYDYQSLLVRMTMEQMAYVGNYFSKIETLKRINMMNESKKNLSWWKAGLSGALLVLIISVLACNDGIVQADPTIEITDVPASVAAKLKSLEFENPGTEYVYYEVEPKQDGYNSEYHAQIDSRDVVYIESFKSRNRLGIIHLKVPSRKIFDQVDEIPNPIGGMEAFYEAVGESMRYPKTARLAGTEGRVFVEFVIDEDGGASNVRAIKGIGSDCDMEAVRVIEAMDPWTPGKIDGKAVSTRMILPITFTLNPDGNI